MVHGKVYLVGAGPGNPKLLTLRAAELLEKADIVIYDRLVGPSILKLAPKTARKIYVGKCSGKHEIPQDKINELIVNAANEGKVIVRLKGGDPFLFGRGGEEAEILVKNRIAFEMVPGVTSAIATPEYAGIPLTHRDYASAVAIVTGHRAGDAGKAIKWDKLSSAVDTIVVLMGIESLEGIVKRLIDGGLDPNKPVAIVEQGTTKSQRTIIGKLNTIVEEATKSNVKPPAVIIVGEVAELGRKLAWFKRTAH
ncbi:MAG TPA: uroporphyrinogen-III C-methyltransferase [Candidatus Sulfotelmatobacter sp.]|nr:uroporphyrinogen-III C-methyltransferase [Candidatus Sulfotelmatobacter sp.]